MTERLKVTVLKTVVVKATVGSNPTPSADCPPSINNQTWGGARVADWARLLSECRDLNLGRGFESRPPRLENTLRFGACFCFSSMPMNTVPVLEFYENALYRRSGKIGRG
jgi:hypothetical protein